MQSQMEKRLKHAVKTGVYLWNVGLSIVLRVDELWKLSMYTWWRYGG